VPLEALGIEGGHLVSLDMQPNEYDAAPTSHTTGSTPLPADATVRVALSRSWRPTEQKTERMATERAALHLMRGGKLHQEEGASS
jgi:hypothetical protein